MAQPSEASIIGYAPKWREDLLALWRLCFADDPPWNEPSAILEQKLRAQPDWILLSIDRDILVGSLVGGYDGVRGWMYHVATHPEHRRRRIASSLVLDLERRLRALGCVKLNLQVRKDNAAVAAFYESLGYQAEPRLSLGKRLA